MADDCREKVNSTGLLGKRGVAIEEEIERGETVGRGGGPEKYHAGQSGWSAGE